VSEAGQGQDKAKGKGCSVADDSKMREIIITLDWCSAVG
jgi:hypothetical protein